MDVEILPGINLVQEQNVSVSVAHRIRIIDGEEFPLQCSGKRGCEREVLNNKIEIPEGPEIHSKGRVNEPIVNRLGVELVELSERSILKVKAFGNQGIATVSSIESIHGAHE